MKIALINARVETYSSYIPPLGLLYVAGVLEKENFNVRVFDPHPKNDIDIEKIIDFKPDVIGVSVLTCYLKRAKYLTSAVKERLKSSVLVVGGVHATALPEETLNYFNADYVVFGEGEITMEELCTRLKKKRSADDINGLVYKKGTNVIKTAPRELIQDLDKLPMPGRHLIEFDKYLFPPGIIRGYWSERCTSLMTSRGCPFKCIWCGTQTTFGRKVRRRSVRNVMVEIEELQKNYNIDTLWFVDDTFTLNKDWVLELCDKLIEQNKGLKWGCMSHVTTLDEEMVSKMKEAGLIQIDFGVESGSNKVLKSLHKNSNEESIKRAFKIAKQAKVRTMATFIFGNPDETKQDVEKTFQLAKEIKPDFTSSFFLTPFPGTELMEMAKKNGWLVNSDYETGGLKKEPMLNINFSNKELIKIREDFQKQFFRTNYLNLFFDIRFLVKSIGLALRYPIGILKGISAFLNTHVFDDFVFAFLIYYSGKKQETN